jgi:hypothetical protein
MPSRCLKRLSSSSQAATRETTSALSVVELGRRALAIFADVLLDARDAAAEHVAAVAALDLRVDVALLVDHLDGAPDWAHARRHLHGRLPLVAAVAGVLEADAHLLAHVGDSVVAGGLLAVAVREAARLKVSAGVRHDVHAHDTSFLFVCALRTAHHCFN